MTKRTPGPDGACRRRASGGVGAADRSDDVVVDDAAAEKSAAEAALRELWQRLQEDRRGARCASG